MITEAKLLIIQENITWTWLYVQNYFFTETWGDNNDVTNSLHSLDNYKNIYQVQSGLKSGSKCIFFHNSLFFKIWTDLSINLPGVESLCVELKTKTGQKIFSMQCKDFQVLNSRCLITNWKSFLKKVQTYSISRERKVFRPI